MAFSPPEDMLSDTTGFCDAGTCLPSGLLRISNCVMHQPLAISHPHLCFADQATKNNISGLHPDPRKHFTKINVEPTSGVVVRVRSLLDLKVWLIPRELFLSQIFTTLMLTVINLQISLQSYQIQRFCPCCFFFF